MNSEEWLKVKEIFHQATELAPDERRTFLMERCKDDSQLLRELELLMESHDEAGHFIEQPALASASDILSVDESYYRPGLMIGQYRVLSEIGRGGMGLVLLCVRADNQFNKRVAIKVLRRGMDSEDIMRRFRNERQILASLEHPYIARLLDGGITTDGLPYFVMEYIEGEPLDNYCDEHRLSVNERLELFRKVCSAVQYAHQNLVVHRDLKPSNILITSEGEPKLLDFGIAKLLKPELTSQTLQPTATFMRLMTPEYASPEQIRGSNITTVSDVYSLGIVLYRLLTGHAPYRFTQTSLQEIEHLVCESEPEKPSTAISRTEEITTGKTTTHITPEAIGEARGESPEALRRRLRGDLDNIVLKALRKEPERRYSSAAQLSEDIRRYMEGLPVTARKDTFSYRASKFIGRNRFAVAATAMVVLAVLTALFVAIWQAKVARAERNRALAAQLKAERINKFLEMALTYSDPSSAAQGGANRQDATINQMLDNIVPRIETELADQPEERASVERTVGIAYAAQNRLDDSERYLQSALKTQLEIFGEDHAETARTLGYLGRLQLIKGDRATAAQTITRALSFYRRTGKQQEANDYYLGSLLTLFYIEWGNGNYSQAETIYQEAMAASGGLQKSERETVAALKGALASIRWQQGRLDEAVNLQRDAVAEYRAIPHLRFDLALALTALAKVLTHKKEYADSLAALHESEAILRETLGDTSVHLEDNLYEQAYTLCLQGSDYREAERLLNLAEEIRQRTVPQNKITLANIDDARGMILTRTTRLAEGERYNRQALDLYQSVLARGANGITLSRMHLAESLIAEKKFEEAERILLEAYKDSSEVQGVQYWRTKDAARALVELYRAWNRPNEAERYQALM